MSAHFLDIHTGAMVPPSVNNPMPVTLLAPGGATGPAGGGAAAAQQVSLTSYTGAGSIGAGAKSFSISNVGAAPGVVQGASVGQGITISASASNGGSFGTITFNATGTTLLVLEVR